MEPKPIAVIEVHPFLNGETDPAIVWTGIAVERKMIELLDNSGCIIISHLLRRDTPLKAGYHIRGKLKRKDSAVTLEVTLSGAGNRALSSCRISAELPLLKKVRNALAEALLDGLGFNRATLSFDPRLKKNRRSALADACILAARMKIDGNQIDQAIALLRTAAAEDPGNVLPCLMLGLFFRKTGVGDSASLWESKARSIDSLAPVPDIFDTLANASPLPQLLSAMKKTKTLVLDTGLSCRLGTVESFGITAIIWSIDPRRYFIDLSPQNKRSGIKVDELIPEMDLRLAVNAGFFEMNGSYMLSPSGLIVINGREFSPLTSFGGSSVFCLKSDVPRLIKTSEFADPSQYDCAFQAGPMLVEPKGKNGIITNDHVRLNRTAIGISRKKVIIAVVFGDKCNGLSLYDLADLLRAKTEDGGAGCEAAMNLDGGASTQAKCFAQKMLIDIKGLWPVNSVVTVRKR